MNIVNALKKVRNDLFDLIVDGLNSKAAVDHFHSYNDLADLPVIDGDGGYVEGAVLYTKQNLTEDQKTQVRENIGAGVSNVEIDSIESLIDSKIETAIENLYPFEELDAPVIYLEQIVNTETNQ